MNKIKITFAMMLLLATFAAHAQTLQRDSITGAWLCEEASMINDTKLAAEEAQALQMLKSAIVNSKFLFKANGLFEWQFPKGTPAVFQQIEFLNNQKWFIDANKNMIHIGDPNENLMQITIREKAGIIYFILSDTPLLLKMKKE